MKKYWMPLSEANDAGLVGGKSYQMSRLLANCGFTPNGVAITTEMLTSFLNLTGVDNETIEEALSLKQEALEKVRHAISFAKWPSEILEQLRELYKQFGGPVCVRSSAVSEDGKSHSYAGVYRSNINLRAYGEFLWGIRDCWLSSVEENAVAYASAVKERLSLMALTVQPLIHSLKSGVAVVEGDIMTISATFGQGQGVVSGQIPCDTYKLNRQGELLFEKIPVKNCCYIDNVENYPVIRSNVYRTWEDGITQGFYVRDSDARNAMLFCDVHLEQFRRIENPVLTKEQLEKLSKELFRLSELYGGNWDFEWSFDGRGYVYVLQARPLLSTLEMDANVVVDAEQDVFAVGVPISKGEITGKVRKISKDEDMETVAKGDIVAIDWIPESCIGILNTAGGLIIGDSSVISHCAIIAREWGVPCVGGINKSILVEGNTYSINGTTGAIKLASSSENQENNSTKSVKTSIDTLPIMFWLVLSLDNILIYGDTVDDCVTELSELCNRYDMADGVDMTGIAKCKIDYENANELYHELCLAGYKRLTEEGYSVIMSDEDSEYMGLKK